MTKQFHSWVYIQEGEMKAYVNTNNLDINVHSIIRNSPKLKWTQMSINWHMDKQM